MEQPTKEEIDDMVATINRDGLEGLTRQEVRELCDAYLAQEGELERKNKLIKMQDGFITDKSKIAAERSTQISQLEVELDQLKAENQALKADIEKHENGYGYLLATGQAEREEMRKRNRRKDQP